METSEEPTPPALSKRGPTEVGLILIALQKIANDPNETPERRHKARVAYENAAMVPRGVPSQPLGNRREGKFMETEIEYRG